ncbi:alpha/beta hydrolase [Actinomadura sp. 1N219]|uniref:alpha/beta hydrolase n=1 Tax=Actinomadura sp. 1N219 TaxID=3375152 RepID=UPI00379432AF
MPHSSKAHWQSLFRGEPVPDIPPARSVEELVSRRRAPAPTALSEDEAARVLLHENVELGGLDTELAAEIYQPRRPGPHPVLMYVHGGGWYAGSPSMDRRYCASIAAEGVLVVSVGYALAPEHPFPRALEDCVYATRWAVKNASSYDGDPARMAIAGSSAGANLAAGTALVLHGSGPGNGVHGNFRTDVRGGDLAGMPVALSGLVLLFGLLDAHRWISEPRYYAGEPEITLAAYLGPNFTGRLRDPLVSPVHSPELHVLPAAYISCGDEDALLGHSLAMTGRLADADVPVTLSVVPNADHEFLKIPERVEGARAENERIVRWLRERLGVTGDDRRAIGGAP